MDKLNLFMPIAKVDVAKREVSGVLSAEQPDHSNEIMDYESGKPEFEKWSKAAEKRSDGKSLGNVRAMHGNIAAGKLIQLFCDDATKSVHGTAKIVDDAEWQKVIEGVYTGYSIGGSYKKKWADPDNKKFTRFTPEVVEVSIVDSPCLEAATFDLIRADGTTEVRKFKTPELKKVAQPRQVWQVADGSTFDKKEDAVKKTAELEKADSPEQLALKALEDAVVKLEPKEEEKEPEKIEETKEIEKEKEEEPVEKAGARHSAADAGHLQEMHGHMKKMKKALDGIHEEHEEMGKCFKAVMDGAEMKDHHEAMKPHIKKALKAHEGMEECMKMLVPEGKEEMEEKAVKPDELEKAAEPDPEKEELKKTIAFLTENMTKLTERVTQIARQPAPTKTALFAVEKGHEVKTGETHEPETFTFPSNVSPDEARRIVSTLGAK